MATISVIKASVSQVSRQMTDWSQPELNTDPQKAITELIRQKCSRGTTSEFSKQIFKVMPKKNKEKWSRKQRAAAAFGAAEGGDELAVQSWW